MKTITKYQLQCKLFTVVVFLGSLLFSNKTLAENSTYIQSNSKLPSYLIGTYKGTLLNNNAIHTSGKCTIRKNTNSRYTLVFSHGASSINNISFLRDDNTYTSFFVYKGTKMAVSLDEDGDLSINSVSGNSRKLSFNGEIAVRGTSSVTKSRGRNGNQSIDVNGSDVLIKNGNQRIGTRGSDDMVIRNGNQKIDTRGNDDVVIRNGNQSIDVNGDDDVIINNNGNQDIDVNGNDVFIRNGNQTINTNGNGVSIKNGRQVISTSKRRGPKRNNRRNGNVSISSGGNDININGQISIGNQNSNVGVEICYGTTSCNISNCNHADSSQYFYECGSHEISQLPLEAIGFYKGDLVGFRADTNKGICKIVETGCKTYRLDFSNNLPSIHGVQFGRKNNFNEYTSIVISGQYSAAIEIDMSFSDLTIDGEIMTIDFDGEKQ